MLLAPDRWLPWEGEFPWAMAFVLAKTAVEAIAAMRVRRSVSIVILLSAVDCPHLKLPWLSLVLAPKWPTPSVRTISAHLSQPRRSERGVSELGEVSGRHERCNLVPKAAAARVHESRVMRWHPRPKRTIPSSADAWSLQGRSFKSSAKCRETRLRTKPNPRPMRRSAMLNDSRSLLEEK